jgi:hypothetical protein
MQTQPPMTTIEDSRAYFEALAARGREPRLGDAVGTWEFDIEGVGQWTVAFDHGELRVAEGQRSPAGGEPSARLRMREDVLMGLVRGDSRDNLLTVLLRGACVIEGDLGLAQRLNLLLPFEQDRQRRTGT